MQVGATLLIAMGWTDNKRAHLARPQPQQDSQAHRLGNTERRERGSAFLAESKSAWYATVYWMRTEIS